jgi:hypothetical protein
MVTLADSGHVKLKAGENHTALTPTQYDELIEEAEGQIITDTRVNWIDIYSTMNTDFREVLRGAVSSYAANNVILNDMLAVGGINTATTMINKNLDNYDRAVSKLKDSNIFKAFGGSVIKE